MCLREYYKSGNCELFTVILFVASGCELCLFGDECIDTYGDNQFTFMYVDSTGNNLLGGATRKYEVNDFKIYSVDSNNEIIFSNLTSYNGISIVDVGVPNTIERSFLEIKGTVTDTLDFKFTNRTSKCCGTIYRIETTSLNGVLYSGSFPIEIVEKD